PPPTLFRPRNEDRHSARVGHPPEGRRVAEPRVPPLALFVSASNADNGFQEDTRFQRGFLEKGAAITGRPQSARPMDFSRRAAPRRPSPARSGPLRAFTAIKIGRAHV